MALVARMRIPETEASPDPPLIVPATVGALRPRFVPGQVCWQVREPRETLAEETSAKLSMTPPSSNLLTTGLGVRRGVERCRGVGVVRGE